MYEIEKGILMPKRVFNRGTNSLLKSMDVGDSFLVDSQRECNRIRVYAYRMDVKIATRKIDNGYRIWRRE